MYRVRFETDSIETHFYFTEQPTKDQLIAELQKDKFFSQNYNADMYYEVYEELIVWLHNMGNSTYKDYFQPNVHKFNGYMDVEHFIPITV